MANKQSIERADGYPPPLRPELGDKADDDAVLKAAETVLLAHQNCVRIGSGAPGGAGLVAAVEPAGYAEAREVREEALRNLMRMRIRSRRAFLATKLALGAVVTWLGSEDPYCEHAMRLLDQCELVMWDGVNSSDPALLALKAIWPSQ